MGDRFDFAADERGVSGVVGFIFVFAILIILLSINQAQVVPAENSEVEFQHFQDVRDDLVEVRSAILTAGQNDVSQFPTVNLGTDYPPRILAVNPPPASGRLATSDAYNITITDASGTTERIETRFLEYRPNYNELDVGSTWYENSVLYLDERGQGGLVVIEEQGLVVGKDSLRITALQNEYRRSGSGRVALELYPTDASDVNISALTGELTVTLPTRLTGADYWTGALTDELSPTVNQDWYETDVHALNFSVQKENVTVNTVGVQAMPEGTAAKQNVGMGEGDAGSENGNGEAQCSIGSNVNSTTLQFDNLENFQVKHGGNNRWDLKKIQVQDSDGDNDLAKLKIEITDSSDIVRASEEVVLSGQQYDNENWQIPPDENNYDVVRGETYTLTVTVCDADGNSRSEARQSTG